jgi:hypothetical protein
VVATNKEKERDAMEKNLDHKHKDTADTHRSKPAASMGDPQRFGRNDEGNDVGHRMYDTAKSAVSGAYQKTSQAVGAGYQRTVDYGREHPERFGLFTFLAGIGVGMIVCSMFPRRTRTERLASPIIDAAADMARRYARRY